jgi:GNAT superfamily N-acetyltransferase
MSIRKVMPADAEAIQQLLDQLGYPATTEFVAQQLPLLLAHPDQSLVVYEQRGRVVGVISIHFIPQLALAGDFATISYLSVAEAVRSEGIGAKLEAYCTHLATERNCDRIYVHCHARREGAHRFYNRQGYQESPKYLMKKL